MLSTVLARKADAVRGNQAWRVANRRGAAGERKLAAIVFRKTLPSVRRGNLLGQSPMQLNIRFPTSSAAAELDVQNSAAAGNSDGRRDEQAMGE